MNRREELLNYLSKVDDKTLLETLIDEFVFLEEQMTAVKKLPFIKVNPKNPLQQKSTPASKLYKELLQQYTNILRILSRYDDNAESEEDSPLRKWVKAHVNSE